MYVIEVIYNDEQNYEIKKYFKNLFVNDTMTIGVELSDNPLEARHFRLVDSVSWKSVYKFLNNYQKSWKVAIKEITVTLSKY